MGQRSQIYIRFNKDGHKGLIASYFSWNYGERMISRARWGIELIKEMLDEKVFATSEINITKISRVFDTNFDMHDYQVSCNIIKEWAENFAYENFNDYVFLWQDNNNGKLLIGRHFCS